MKGKNQMEKRLNIENELAGYYIPTILDIPKTARSKEC